MEDEQNLLPVNPEDITGLNSADARQAMQFMTTASDYLTENKQQEEGKEEVRNGQANEGEYRYDLVLPFVLLDRGVYSHGYAEEPGECQ